MEITRASEHVVSGLDDERYCDADDVAAQLIGVAVDINGQMLGAWVSSSVAEVVIARAIVTAREWLDWQTRRDFDFHEEVDVALDGSGEDSMHLENLGFIPLVELGALTVNDVACDLDNYAAYRDGRVEVKSYAPPSRYTGRSSGLFTAGTQNVEMTLTWGYEDAPNEIKTAQAQKAAAIILEQLQRADMASGDVEPGYTEVDYGDLRIRVGSKGRYGDAIDGLEKSAEKICMRYRVPLVSSARARYRGIPNQPEE